MSNWSYKKLNELGFLSRGKSKHRPRNARFLYNGPYPFVQTADITNSELHVIQYTQTYSKAGLAQSKIWDKGTLCIVNAGVNTGDTGILSFNACFPDSIIGFVSDNNKSDVRFIKYFLDLIKPRIRQITMGATQDNLSMAKLLTFNVPTPPVCIQRKIASILSSYDILLENNNRRIQILEEMAKTIYEEWFVNFHFAGHTKPKKVKSKIGLIPQGWQVVKLNEYVDFIRGIEPGSDNYRSERKEGTVPFLRVGDLGKRASEIFIDEELAEGRAISQDDIVVSLDGTVGIVRVGLEGCYSTGIRKLKIRNNWVRKSFLYCLMRSEHIQNIIKAHTKGSTIQHASASIDYMDFILPPESMINKFDEIADPMIENILKLNKINNNLRATRDHLLPKLINGEINVDKLNINVANEARYNA